MSASVRRREFIASDVKEERAFAFPIRQCYRYTIYAGGKEVLCRGGRVCVS